MDKKIALMFEETPPKLQFIDDTPVDAGAAYKRLEITRSTFKNYRRDINDTNTAGMPQALKDLYSDLFTALVAIEVHEQALIKEGK